ncbi:four helix bundle protein [Synoicihabitans lomoniglobus]|uniref:Four helix bundle protein n=1 Tax=Synoicihabitans lomoniglobus TaxID=2909285 RepID=A0AAE9ZUK1_9BACT|nr:four helix bundle protein [Opitutaceae bacterium LMO-M01]WED64576.1 four helix bundle protein [Opitutaceae bacterium LMO-M01]
MSSQFDHEKLRAYQQALEFVGFVGPVLDGLAGKIAAKDQLDRASTSVVLNLAEGNGKRSHPDRCRFFDIARGSAVECAACLDVLVVRGRIEAATADEGKTMLLGVVSMLAGLIARFGGRAENVVNEEQADYGVEDLVENEND